MNCFVARKEFVSFWRGTLGGERRRDFMVHLKKCNRCDRAFRAFSLTAPMLHSGHRAVQAGVSRPAAPAGFPAAAHKPTGDTPFAALSTRTDAARSAEILRRASVHRLEDRRPKRKWSGAAAAVSAMAAAVLVGYFSIPPQPQSFEQAIISPMPETSAQSESDLLGQQMPSIMDVSNEVAG
jgi:hypothetical protein